ncbi:MAG TPA: hypothetical protein VGC07_03405 [Granulicella sp.]
MMLLRKRRSFSQKLGKRLSDSIATLPETVNDRLHENNSALLKTVGWVSAGMGALAIGLLVGRELRQRYKFNRRTPYDLYAHSGDEQQQDFGLGT